METRVQEDILLFSSTTIFESIDDNLLKLFNFWSLLNTKNPEYYVLE